MAYDLSRYTSLQLNLFVEGLNAARRGDAFDATRCDEWQFGFLEWRRPRDPDPKAAWERQDQRELEAAQ